MGRGKVRTGGKKIRRRKVEGVLTFASPTIFPWESEDGPVAFISLSFAGDLAI